MNTEQLYPLISVIVPVYKVEQYLENCIESVIGQSYKNWELILVDDGSPDNCPQICDNYAVKDSRIRVIHKANGGLSSARNAGLDVFNGEYVTFLDSDDFWHGDYLNIMMSLCIENNAKMSQCAFVRGRETFFPIDEVLHNVEVYNNHSIFTSFKANIIMCGKLYDRSLFDDIRMPIGLINEDDWTAWKLYYKSSYIAVTQQPLYYYTVNPNSIMGTQRKKVDLTYIGAYEERIAFFKGTGEFDLECCSHIQLCKSMVLMYSNSTLSVSDREMVKNRFNKSWCVIRRSKFVPSKFRLLFGVFYKMPSLAIRIMKKFQ